MGAHGLLGYLLSQEDGKPVDIKYLAKIFPDGQAAFRSYFRELVAAGYVVRRRVRRWDEESGQWLVRTETAVYDIPQDEGSFEDLSVVTAEFSQVTPRLNGPSLEDTSPLPSGVMTRDQEPPSRPPVQEPIPDLGREVEIAEEFEQCAAVLRAVGRDDVRLYLGIEEMLPLLPLVRAWLDRGVPAGQIRQVLTQGLPVPVYSAKKLIEDRLRRKMPDEKAAVTQLRGRPRLVECPDCGRPTAGSCSHGAVAQPRALSEEDLARKAAHIARLRDLVGPKNRR